MRSARNALRPLLYEHAASGWWEGDETTHSAVDTIRKVWSGFAATDATEQVSHDLPTDLMHVFVGGSRVCFPQAGQMAVEVEVIQPTIMNDTLIYQIATPPKPGQRPSKRWVAAKHVEPSAEADVWSYALWDPTTEQYVDQAESGMS